MTHGAETGSGPQSGLTDLTHVLTMPALQTAIEPRDVASAMQAALLNTLRLACVVVRLTDPEHGRSIEMMRDAEWSGDTERPGLFFASARLGLEGELGIVVAASDRPDFPQDTETVLLKVAANRATVALQRALLAVERRRAADAARKSRSTEDSTPTRIARESRLVMENIPGFVATLTPTGEVEFVNDRLVEYCGQPLEAMRRWGTNGTVMADDLPRIGPVFAQAIASGTPYDFEARIRRFDGVYRWHDVRGLSLRDPTGQIVRWYVLLTDINDRKLAEDALRESERESRLVVDSIPGLVAVFTAAGDVEFVNRQVLEYFGMTLEELKHWGTGRATHPEDLPRVVELFTRSIVSGEPFDFEVRARRFDGVYRWFQSRGFPLQDSTGRIVRWYNLLIDIDERKRAEQELRRSEARKAAILDSAIDCIVTIDHEGCITEFNPAAERAFGYRRNEVLGQQLADVIVPPALRQRHRQGFAHYVATGESRVLGKRIEMTAVRADGSEFPTELAITRIPLDGPPSFTGYLRDITDRRQAEEKLRRSEAFLAEGQLLSRVGSFSWHVATDEIMWSEQLYRIFELDRNVRVTLEVIGARVHPEDLPVFTEQIERSRQDGSDVQLEIRLQMPDRTVKYVHVVAHCREHGDQLEYIGAVQDVTQRRLSEEALAKFRSDLAHVARVTSLGVLTASIAHEVNQPLAGIITNASTCLRMLGADPPDVDGARETARRTIRDGNRASDVISRLRELFSKREFTLEPLDLNEATREVIALSSNDLQRNRVILQSELANDLPIVTGNRIQLQQVILNFLRNASDAMVEVHDRPRQLLIKTEREHGDYVRLTVRDRGVGLPPHSIDSLFDAFYTTKSGGMGIGLFVSRSIVERHQGRLWAESNDGPGAAFSFSIPVDLTRMSEAASVQRAP
jgi:PAS domain S-box-containing protein